MKTEGFRYLPANPTDTSRSAGSQLNFTLAGRKEAGFGIAALLDPRIPPSQDQDQDAAFQSSLLACKKQELKKVQVYFDAISAIGTDYLARHELLQSTPEFRRFQKLYTSCMADSGFPGIEDSNAAFFKASVPYKAKLSIPQIRAVEIPISVADFQCVTKYDRLRRERFGAQEADFLADQENNFALLETLE